MALAIRWVRLGGKAPAWREVEPDPDYQTAFQREVLTPIVEHYFRGTLYQLKNLPQEGPLIIAMNHAGMCFPWDFVGLGLLLSQQRAWFVQPLAHAIFFDHPWLIWWLPPGWAQVLGGVRAERQSFEAAIANKAILLYAPEGWRGLAKGWQQRYQLATFDPSFIRLSVRYQVPIVPVICLGSEYLHPFAFNVRRLAQWLHLPMFPISPLILAFCLFPSLGVWAVRTRLQYFVQPVWCPWEEEGDRKRREEGELSDFDELASDPASNSASHPGEGGVGILSRRAVNYRMAEELRSRLQATLDDLRKEKGKEK